MLGSIGTVAAQYGQGQAGTSPGTLRSLQSPGQGSATQRIGVVGSGRLASGPLSLGPGSGGAPEGPLAGGSARISSRGFGGGGFSPNAISPTIVNVRAPSQVLSLSGFQLTSVRATNVLQQDLRSRALVDPSSVLHFHQSSTDSSRGVMRRFGAPDYDRYGMAFAQPPIGYEPQIPASTGFKSTAALISDLPDSVTAVQKGRVDAEKRVTMDATFFLDRAIERMFGGLPGELPDIDNLRLASLDFEAVRRARPDDPMPVLARALANIRSGNINLSLELWKQSLKRFAKEKSLDSLRIKSDTPVSPETAQRREETERALFNQIRKDLVGMTLPPEMLPRRDALAAALTYLNARNGDAAAIKSALADARKAMQDEIDFNLSRENRTPGIAELRESLENIDKGLNSPTRPASKPAAGGPVPPTGG